MCEQKPTAPQIAEPRDGDIYRHTQRGTSYTVLGCANLQTSRHIGEGERLVVYQGIDGRLWVRPVTEFGDGRFEPVGG